MPSSNDPWFSGIKPCYTRAQAIDNLCRYVMRIHYAPSRWPVLDPGRVARNLHSLIVMEWRDWMHALVKPAGQLKKGSRVLVANTAAARGFPGLPPPGTFGVLMSEGKAFRAPGDARRYFQASFQGYDRNRQGGVHLFQVAEDMIELAPG